MVEPVLVLCWLLATEVVVAATAHIRKSQLTTPFKGSPKQTLYYVRYLPPIPESHLEE